jgi:hypothetical protein
MADDLTFWKSRLMVQVTSSEEPKQTILITPIDSFSPSFSLNAEVLHSIERTHLGLVYSPQSITFSMTVKAVGNVVGLLTQMAFQGKRFEVVLKETEGSTDWSFDQVVLRDCIITSCSPTTATPSGAPTATFSGVSLQSTIDPKAGDSAVIPNVKAPA